MVPLHSKECPNISTQSLTLSILIRVTKIPLIAQSFCNLFFLITTSFPIKMGRGMDNGGKSSSTRCIQTISTSCIPPSLSSSSCLSISSLRPPKLRLQRHFLRGVSSLYLHPNYDVLTFPSNFSQSLTNLSCAHKNQPTFPPKSIFELQPYEKITPFGIGKAKFCERVGAIKWI